ncbi:MAG: hypothetical protein COB16_10630 [Rhodobacteraceae bacterium]|nr:MAG: hypothetical protein COB16_10630 [Paracoccaceae bacterium]
MSYLRSAQQEVTEIGSSLRAVLAGAIIDNLNQPEAVLHKRLCIGAGFEGGGAAPSYHHGMA